MIIPDLPLFSQNWAAPFSRSGTSKNAAKSVDKSGSAANRRNIIHDLAASRGLLGLTCYEAEVILNLTLNQNGTHPRFWELEKAGLLFVIDDKIVERKEAITRLTRTNRPAQVYFASIAVTVDEVLNHYGLKRRVIA